MATEGVPKVDTINFSYFVPGVAVTAGTLLGVGPSLCGRVVTTFPTWLPDVSSATSGVVFLAFSYVVGYALWGVGDIILRAWSDHFICERLFDYVCRNKPLRLVCLERLRSTGHIELAAFLETEWKNGRSDEIEEPTLKPKARKLPGKQARHFGIPLRRFLWDTHRVIPTTLEGSYRLGTT